MTKIITKKWNGGIIVKISSVGKEFEEWLAGQTTVPIVGDDGTTEDWAFYGDYERFISDKEAFRL